VHTISLESAALTDTELKQLKDSGPFLLDGLLLHTISEAIRRRWESENVDVVTQEPTSAEAGDEPLESPSRAVEPRQENDLSVTQLR
jgi:hypothetical protein